MDIDHAAGHFDFRVHDVILFINQKYDATMLIIRGCRCVNAMVVSAIFINYVREIILIFVFPERLRQRNSPRGIHYQKNPFLGSGRSGGPQTTTIPHDGLQPCHIRLDGFERNRKQLCGSASQNTGGTYPGILKIA